MAMHSHERLGWAMVVTCTTFQALVALVCCLLVAPLAAGAQPPAKVHRIGFLSPFSPIPQNSHLFEAFRQGLRDLGYLEGQNLIIEWRWTHESHDRASDLAAELVRQKVEVIVAVSPPAPQAAHKATHTIPIVFVLVGDPVAQGLVASLARPGGNLTGLSTVTTDLVGKQLELLKEAVPTLSRVAVLRNPGNPGHSPVVEEAERAVRTLGLRLAVVEAGSADALEGAFRLMAAKRVGGALVLRDGLFNSRRARIADLATKAALPTMFGIREEAEAGGLMAYGVNLAASFRRAATFVDKILKGAKPADLPVEQPTRFELVVNLKTAKALGLTIPQSVLVRADHVIQ